MRAVCEVRRLGLVPYRKAWDMQIELVRRRARGDIPDQLLLLEHPHVFTLGRRGRTEHVLSTDAEIQAAGAEIVQSDRGGDATYHGPGQLVGYPIVYLDQDQRDIPVYVRRLEEAVIRTLGDFGIKGQREAAFPGVWVGDEKICAVGVKISEWVTHHGFALNVSTELDYFHHIVPCGIVGKWVTSTDRLLSMPVTIQDISTSLVARFGEVFDREMVEVTRLAGAGSGRR